MAMGRYRRSGKTAMRHVLDDPRPVKVTATMYAPDDPLLPRRELEPLTGRGA